MTERQSLSIDEERLWTSLIDLARIGATPKEGCNRLALTDDDLAGRDLFVRWTKEAGCTVSVTPWATFSPGGPGRMTV